MPITSIKERIDISTDLFLALQSTNSRLEKEALIAEFHHQYPDCREDFDWIFEVLNGRYPIGYTLADYIACGQGDAFASQLHERATTLKKYFSPLWYPLNEDDMSRQNILDCVFHFTMRDLKFISPVVDRTLRLGYSNKNREITNISPMLAKKWQEEKHKLVGTPIIVQPKLDGNRCLAYFNKDSERWVFQSRNGKQLRVCFDMDAENFNREIIYDGEIIDTQSFNSTNGTINSINSNKDTLHYHIYDIIIPCEKDLDNYNRNKLLQECVDAAPLPSNIHIVSQLFFSEIYNPKVDDEIIDYYLGKEVAKGGEGLIIRSALASYQHKRTSSLLKYKKSKTMDLRVVGWQMGEGKYEGQIGALKCTAKSHHGYTIFCEVGSGLTDIDRSRPFSYFDHKIIEVEYFEETTNADGGHSLRFPRFKRIRLDKIDDSTY